MKYSFSTGHKKNLSLKGGSKRRIAAKRYLKDKKDMKNRKERS